MNTVQNTPPTVPQTEGIKYAGSKLKLLPHILRLARTTEAKTVLDGFSGTTRVSQAFAKSGYAVVANDVAVWSQVFGECFLRARKSRAHYESLISHLNNTPPADGWFTEHYGGCVDSAIGADGLKKPWQQHNTRKLDGIRMEIEKLKLDKTDRAVALTGLILAMDKVDNTIGHYAAYLGKWSARSYHPLLLTVPDTSAAGGEHRVLCGDIFSALPRTDADLAYYDPPYGSNNHKMPASRVRYAAYYHVWKSICLFDRPPLFGRAKRRADTSDRAAASPFEDFRRDDGGRFVAAQALEDLVRETPARWIILSYSSGGRAADELREVLSRHGKLLEEVAVDYRRNVMAEMTWTDEWTPDCRGEHREFLFLLEKESGKTKQQAV